jgi:hypothetical protein
VTVTSKLPLRKGTPSFAISSDGLGTGETTGSPPAGGVEADGWPMVQAASTRGAISSAALARYRYVDMT